MGQFDRIEDTKKVEGADVENIVIIPKESVVNAPNDEELQAIETAKAENKEADQAKFDEIRNELMGENENKEEFPEGHIMNLNMLDKIAQLEAINPDTSEFDQDRYDNYMNGQSKLGAYSVGENQKIIKEKIQQGKSLEKALLRTEIIYGDGGWNRYRVDPFTGMVKLLRGVSNTSGSGEYKAKLAEKAKEIGLVVEGQ